MMMFWVALNVISSNQVTKQLRKPLDEENYT